MPPRPFRAFTLHEMVEPLLMDMSEKGIFVFRYSQTFSDMRFRLPEKLPRTIGAVTGRKRSVVRD